MICQPPPIEAPDTDDSLAKRALRPHRVMGAALAVVMAAIAAARPAVAGAPPTLEPPVSATRACAEERLQAESKIREFDKSDGEAFELAKEAGDMYLAIWKRYGEAAVKAGKPPECGRLDEVLYNAARAYLAAKLPPLTIATSAILIEHQAKLGGSELARKSVYQNAYLFLALGEYAEATVWLERYARESPQHERAEEALVDAAILRLALGQRKEAEEDAARYLKNYGAKKPARAGQLAFAIAEDCSDKGDFKCVETRLKASLSLIERGRIDITLRARAALGRALAALKDEKGAEVHYKAVVSAFRDPEAILKRIQMDTGDDLRSVGQALNALGEAHFFLAGLERKKAMAEPIPVYKGPADKQAIAKFLTEKTGPALLKRRSAIEGVEKLYIKILGIAPAPPPKWVIAAGAEVFGMWSETLEQARAIEITGKTKAGKELEKTLNDTVLSALEPFLQRAKAAAKMCLGTSVKFQFTSESSERCAAWLSKSFPKEFPRMDELSLRPSLLATGVGRPQPIRKPAISKN